MLMAYLSADEVNRDWASRIAAGRGAILQHFSPHDPLPDGRFDAVVYDLESMAPQRRREFIARLLAAAPTRPVAVHSYNLDAQADALRDTGVIVSRRLARAVVLALCRAIGSLPAPGARVGISGELAATDLIGEITVSALGVACSGR
jgi:hypothetical protein